MGGSAEERARWKEPFHSLEVELERDFGLSLVSSRALTRRLGEFIDTFLDSQPSSFSDQSLPGGGVGQIWYQAVATGERAGKPLRHCLTVPVRLTLLHGGDAEVLHQQGSPHLRRLRLARLCGESHRQGAVLSYEDLAVLLGLDVSSVGRLVRLLAEEGERPVTRGLVEDIGPTVSHKEQVLRLYFRGLLPARIAARTGHTLGSVERYLGDFARVAELRRQGVAPAGIVRITGMSATVIRRYIELIEQLDQPEHRSVMERLLRRFAPTEEEVSHG